MNVKNRDILAAFRLPLTFIVAAGLLAIIVMIVTTKTTLVNAASPTLTCRTSEVNIVAHQDDDILFMNPDIHDSIRQKRCVETVFLTAGEWNGTDTMTREQYAASRMKGTRAAYASMANVADNWTRTVTTINGRSIETARLVGAPHVTLIYLHIRDGSDSVSRNSLIGLYKGDQTSIATMVPSDSPAGVTSLTYTKASLSQTLLSIMQGYKATVIRTQDYLPDPRLQANHKDHIHGALFAIGAARNYTGVSGNSRVNTVTYRDYNMIQSPANLNTSRKNTKSRHLDAYKAHDSIFGIPGTQSMVASRMYYRWPVAPTWVAMNKGGKLQAFDVQNGKLMTWKQDAAGKWSGMQKLGNSGLQPGVGVGTNSDGTLQVFVVKQTINSQGVVRQDVQYRKQTTPGGSFGSWKSLGSPGPHATKGTYDIGTPSVALNADGRIELFLKDSNGNLSTIYQTRAGTYSSWVNLGGSGALMETPTSILRKDGRIEVFAATRGDVKHWLQRAPNSTIVYDAAFTSASAVGTPSAGFNQDGRPEIFYRRAGSGRVHTTYQKTSGAWYSGEVSLRGHSSFGAPAVVNHLPTYQRGSRMVLVSRQASTGYQFVAQRRANASFDLPWALANNSYSQHAPAAILDRQNRVHAITLSQDSILTDRIVTLQP